MRRRKPNRGRPRKVKKGRYPLRKDNSSTVKAEEDSKSAPTSDFEPCVTGYSQTGPTSYRIGSTHLETAGAEDDVQPIFKESDIVLEVECGANKAHMYLSRLCQGSKGQCIEFDGARLTPNEFQYISGRETAKDWKRSIRHYGRSLKLLLTKGILAVHPSACRCDSCRMLVESSPNKAVLPTNNKGKSASDSKEGKENANDKDDNSKTKDEENDETEEEEVEKGSEEEEEEEEEEEKDEKETEETEEDEEEDDDEDDEEEEKEEEKKEVKEKPEEPTKRVSLKLKLSGKNVIKKSEPSESSSSSSEDSSSSSGSDSSSASTSDSSDTEEEPTVPSAAQEPSKDKTSSKSEDDQNISEAAAGPASTEDADDAKAATETLASEDMLQEDQTDKAEEPEEEERKDEVPQKEEEDEKEVIPEKDKEDELELKSTPEAETTEVSEEAEKDAEEQETQDVEMEEKQEEGTKEKVSESEMTAAAEEKVEEEEEEEECSKAKDNSSSESEINEMKEDAKADANQAKKSQERPNSTHRESRLSSIINQLRTTKERQSHESPELSSRRQLTEQPRKEETPPQPPLLASPVPALIQDGVSAISGTVAPPARKETAAKQDSPQRKPVSDRKREHPVRDHSAISAMEQYAKELSKRARLEAEHQKYQSQKLAERHKALPTAMYPTEFDLSLLSSAHQFNLFHAAMAGALHEDNMNRLAREQFSPFDQRGRHSLTEDNSLLAKLTEKIARHAQRHEVESTRVHHAFPTKADSSSKRASHLAYKKQQHSRNAAPASTVATPTIQPAHSNSKLTTVKDILGTKTDDRRLQTPPKAHDQQPTTNRHALTANKPPSSLPLPASSSRASYPSTPSPLHMRSSPMAAPMAPMQMWSSCFPVPVPPPTLEMTKLTQFFPNLNGGLFSPNTGSKRAHEPENALDLSQKRSRISDKPRHRSHDRKSPASYSADLERRLINGIRPSSSSSSSSSRYLSQSLTSSPAFQTPPARPSSANPKAHNKSWSDYESKRTANECTCALKHVDDIRSWSTQDVCRFMKDLDGCAPYIETFRRHGVDGKSLPLLTTDSLTKSLGMKLGPALVLTGAVARKAREIGKIVPCEYCRKKIQRG